MAIGLITSTVFALLAVKWLVAFLNKRGLTVFGWYRLALAGLMLSILGLHG
jgi:undecaprenyl-diphosphatase